MACLQGRVLGTPTLFFANEPTQFIVWQCAMRVSSCLQPGQRSVEDRSSACVISLLVRSPNGELQLLMTCVGVDAESTPCFLSPRKQSGIKPAKQVWHGRGVLRLMLNMILDMRSLQCISGPQQDVHAASAGKTQPYTQVTANSIGQWSAQLQNRCPFTLMSKWQRITQPPFFRYLLDWDLLRRRPLC